MAKSKSRYSFARIMGRGVVDTQISVGTVRQVIAAQGVGRQATVEEIDIVDGRVVVTYDDGGIDELVDVPVVVGTAPSPPKQSPKPRKREAITSQQLLDAITATGLSEEQEVELAQGMADVEQRAVDENWSKKTSKKEFAMRDLYKGFAEKYDIDITRAGEPPK